LNWGGIIHFGLGTLVGGVVGFLLCAGHLPCPDRNQAEDAGVRSPGALPSDYAPMPAIPETTRQSQRTWADLFAACRLVDAWLGADVDGRPTCYPIGQEAKTP
jgi:hypothetical protein